MFRPEPGIDGCPYGFTEHALFLRILRRADRVNAKEFETVRPVLSGLALLGYSPFKALSPQAPAVYAGLCQRLNPASRVLIWAAAQPDAPPHAEVDPVRRARSDVLKAVLDRPFGVGSWQQFEALAQHGLNDWSETWADGRTTLDRVLSAPVGLRASGTPPVEWGLERLLSEARVKCPGHAALYGLWLHAALRWDTSVHAGANALMAVEKALKEDFGQSADILERALAWAQRQPASTALAAAMCAGGQAGISDPLLMTFTQRPPFPTERCQHALVKVLDAAAAAAILLQSVSPAELDATNSDAIWSRAAKFATVNAHGYPGQRELPEEILTHPGWWAALLIGDGLDSIVPTMPSVLRKLLAVGNVWPSTEGFMTRVESSNILRLLMPEVAAVVARQRAESRAAGMANAMIDFPVCRTPKQRF